MRERIVYALGLLLVIALIFIWTVRSAGDFLAVWFPLTGQLGVNPSMLLAEIAAVAVIVIFLGRAVR